MAIYRGTGGSAEATNNATVNEVAGYATDAETSATNAASSATSAASSATSASSSATASASSATASESSATASATSASASATSATNASTSASQAASSASAASTSASNALTSETNAASSETAAASSATSAATSATSAATSASNASTSETNAATSASNASTSETNAATSASEAAASAASIISDELESAANAAAAAQSYDNFDDRYLGAKATEPTVDNDGDALITGAMYFDSSNNVMKVYSGTEWQNASSSIEGIKSDFVFTATASQVLFSGSDDNTNTLVIDKAGLVNVYLNGVRLTDADYTVDAPGNSVTLGSGATVGDIVEIEVFGNFAGQSGADVAITGGSITGLTELSTGTFTSTGIDDNATSTAITIDASENVGIGTASPSAKLHIDGTDTTVLITEGNEGGARLMFADSQANPDQSFELSYDTGGTNELLFRRNNSTVGRWMSQGFVVGQSNATSPYAILSANNDATKAGAALRDTGYLAAARYQAEAMNLNRMGTDGAIADFRKDGSIVGSIGAKSNDLTIGTGDTGLKFVDGFDMIQPVDTTSGADRDGAVSLGFVGQRFKDLYLSGGVRKQESMIFSSNVTRHDFAFIGNTNPDSSVFGDRAHAHEMFLEGNYSGYDLVFNAKVRSASGGAGTDRETLRIKESGELVANYGVYLGGTGAANKLDDYEEGTFTPTVTGSTTAGSHTVTYAGGSYTKIGRKVTAIFVYSAYNGTGSGNMVLGGFPFSIDFSENSGTVFANSGVPFTSGRTNSCVVSSSTAFQVREMNPTGGGHSVIAYPTAPTYLRTTVTYFTND